MHTLYPCQFAVVFRLASPPAVSPGAPVVCHHVQARDAVARLVSRHAGRVIPMHVQTGLGHRWRVYMLEHSSSASPPMIGPSSGGDTGDLHLRRYLLIFNLPRVLRYLRPRCLGQVDLKTEPHDSNRHCRVGETNSPFAIR